MNTAIQDLRYSVRTLAQRPAFTLLAEIYTAGRQDFVGPYGVTSWLDYADYRDRSPLTALHHE